MTLDNAPSRVFDESAFIARHRAEAQNMFQLIDHLLNENRNYEFALDIGGGYGDHLPFIQDRVDKVIVADIIDYLEDKNFSPKTLQQRARNCGSDLNLQKIAFHHCDAHNLFYRENLFDLVFSVNAFEHIPNPILALSEALRVARVGAPIYIQFDPIWNSPHGHHLPHLNLDPWTHLLVDESEFSRIIVERGGDDEDITVFKTAMNEHSLAYFRRIFLTDLFERFSSVHFETWSKDPAEEPATQHPNFERCLARGYTVDELITRGVQFFGIKQR